MTLLHTGKVAATDRKTVEVRCSCGWDTDLGSAADLIMVEVSMTRHCIDVVGPDRWTGSLIFAFDEDAEEAD